jgi:pilus assembly protein CpaC
MLSVAAPQQVMLEVKVAEISKTVLDQFGINFARAYSPADGSLIRFLSGIFGGAGLVAGHLGGTVGGNVGGGGVGSTTNGAFTGASTAPAGDASIGGSTTTIPIAAGKNNTSLGVDAQKKDGLVKVLAEPTVMAVSGQEGSFLAGGKIFIPVSRTSNSGTTTFELAEKEFGVSLKFTPTVLADGRINLRVNPEVSELNPQGVGITAPGVTGLAILPSFTTRRAATTVQLFDGQSFAIGGLIKNNVNANIKAFPLLGELPIIGALFRSSDFQTDRSELVFVITPRLVKPLPPDYALPTDSYTPPTRKEFYLDGKLEGSRKEGGSSTETETSVPVDAQTDAPPPLSGLPAGGYQVK